MENLTYFLGLDLGQQKDHSAIAVIERWEEMYGRQAPRFGGVRLRHLERIPLGTPYPAVVERVRALAMHAELRGRVSVWVDATGLGAPVVDQLRAARQGFEITGVTITGGAMAHSMGTRSSAMGGVPRWSVPKTDLMSGLQVLLERGELKIAGDLPELQSLRRELCDVRMTPKRGGKMRMGADGPGEHDDLVIAVALACWGAKRQRSMQGQGRIV